MQTMCMMPFNYRSHYYTPIHSDAMNEWFLIRCTLISEVYVFVCAEYCLTFTYADGYFYDCTLCKIWRVPALDAKEIKTVMTQ